MSSTVEIQADQSARLQQIALEKGVKPAALVEEALNLLFQQADREQAAQEEQAFLSRLQAEGNISASARTRSPFSMDNITVTHRVSVNPAALRQSEG